MSVNQPQKTAWEEGIALGVHEELGDLSPPISAFDLVRRLGLRLVFTDTIETARWDGDVTIYVNSRLWLIRQHGLVAHELGHLLTVRAGELDSEGGADYLAGALMLPQREFSRDLRDSRWDLRLLQAKHIYCSAELVARRIVGLRDACVAIWDDGKLKKRIVSPWLAPGYHRMSKFEEQLAADVLASGETIEADQLLWGFAVFSDHSKRVITVCEAEQLSMRY